MDMGTAMINFATTFQLILNFVWVVCVLVGFTYLIDGILTSIKLATYGQSSGATTSQIWSSFVFSVIFCIAAVFLGDSWQALTGEIGNRSIAAYSLPGSDLGGNPFLSSVIVAVLKFVQLAGAFFGVSGLFKLKKASDGGQSNGGESLVGTGLSQFFGGLACMNIGSFLASLFEIASHGAN